MGNELKHFGILGMKWGVRRTPEQLGRTEAKGSKKQERLSDEELRKRLTRARMEEEYATLVSRQNAQSTSKAKSLVKSALDTYGKQLITAAASALAVGTVKAIGGQIQKRKFNVQAFDYADTSKVDSKRLQEAVDWYSTNTRYEAARKAYRER